MLTIADLTFEKLASRFGEVVAYHCLEQIERAAHMQPRWIVSNPEIRLAEALRAQDAMSRQFSNVAA